TPAPSTWPARQASSALTPWTRSSPPPTETSSTPTSSVRRSPRLPGSASSLPGASSGTSSKPTCTCGNRLCKVGTAHPSPSQSPTSSLHGERSETRLRRGPLADGALGHVHARGDRGYPDQG